MKIMAKSVYLNGFHIDYHTALTSQYGSATTSYRLLRNDNNPTFAFRLVDHHICSGRIGDFNEHCKVDENDLCIFTEAYIKYYQGQPFNPLCDNNDGKVDANDFFMFVSACIPYWSA